MSEACRKVAGSSHRFRGSRKWINCLLPVLMIVIGAALLVQAFAGVGSVLSARTIVGVLFLAAGAGRIYVEWRRGEEG